MGLPGLTHFTVRYSNVAENTEAGRGKCLFLPRKIVDFMTVALQRMTVTGHAGAVRRTK